MRAKFIFSLSLLFIIGIQNSLCQNNNFSPVNGGSIVDDCCCEVDTVLESNSQDLHPILNELVTKRFFKYFKLDLYSDCPFWVTDFLCGTGGCAVCECNEDEVPMFWNEQKTDRVDVSTPDNFMEWNDVEDNMWTVQGSKEEMSYVNLQMYPEGNTNYDGSMIWNRIYNENCFKGPIDSMCLEERVFYRLLSGMHTSINMHIAKNFEFDEKTKTWKSNLQFFKERVQNHPDRIKNLYFAFLFLLRSVHKVAPVLDQYVYDTGNPAEDLQVQKLMKQLLSTKLLCSPNFDESILFNEPEKDTIKQQFKNHFRNISLMLNCVSCEKCKVYSKLQTLAIGTALKILFGGMDTSIIARQLQRNEIIALLNTLRQFSLSIENIKYMSALVDGAKETEVNKTATTTASSLLDESSHLTSYLVGAALVAVLVGTILLNKRKSVPSSKKNK